MPCSHMKQRVLRKILFSKMFGFWRSRIIIDTFSQGIRPAVIQIEERLNVVGVHVIK